MARIINHRFRKDGAWFGESGTFLYEVTTGNNRRFDRSTLNISQGRQGCYMSQSKILQAICDSLSSGHMERVEKLILHFAHLMRHS